MLVLSRGEGETIVIDEEITVTVVRIKGDKVRLGLVGPDNVNFARAEVFDPEKVQERKNHRRRRPVAGKPTGGKTNGRAA